MTPPTDWKRNLLAPVLALAMLGSLVALPAIAAPSTKKIYTASFDNTGAPAGTQVVRALTLTNSNTSSATQSFASARVKIPTGFTGVSATLTPPTGKTWQTPVVNLTTGKIELQSGAGSTSANAISPGQSIVVTITATAPCSGTSFEWTTQVKQSNDFSGNNNDFTLSGAQPKLTLSGSCANKIAFVSGFAPSDTTAGGAMSMVKVFVTNFSDVAISGNVVTLTGDIQNSGSVTATTGIDGIAVFDTIKASKTPTPPSSTSSLTATEAGGQSVAGSFVISPATIAFVQQPTLTQYNLNIAPAPSVKVSGAGGVGIQGVTVTMSIGTNPAGGVLAGTVQRVTDANGVATFDSAGTFTALSIGPDDTVTSSGYQLSASATESGSPVLSEPFAISNTIAANCDPCVAEFENGSTITAPGGTTLIIENSDPAFCSSITTVIAGTVTVIPTGDGNKLLTFVDPHGNGSTPDPVENVTYPVCKTNGVPPGPVSEHTLDYANVSDRCAAVDPTPACIENQYFQIGSLDLVTKVLISAVDPTLKR